MFKKILLCGLLWISHSSIAAPLHFGYFHATLSDLRAVQDHVSLIMVQAANPMQPLHEIMSEHPEKKLVFGFHAIEVEVNLNRQSRRCAYNKCFHYDETQANLILNAVEQEIGPYLNRTYALYIGDEIETNPISIDSMNRLINNIRSRPLLKNLKLWINYDNVYPQYTATSLIISDVDIVSLTPSYGRYCGFTICEHARYEYFLAMVRQQKPAAQLMVIGDAWGAGSDVDRFGNLTAIGKNHLDKVPLFYSQVKNIADTHNIKVAGMVVFSYSEPQYGLVSSHDDIRNAWRRESDKILNPSGPTPPSIPLFPPDPELPNSPPCECPPQTKPTCEIILINRGG